MTHELSEDFPTFGGVPGIVYDKQFDIASDGYNLYKLTIDEHSGTHIDAPLHFSADGMSVAEIPIESLACPLCVIDIRARAATDRNAQVTPDDLQAWIDANGEIPEGALRRDEFGLGREGGNGRVPRRRRGWRAAFPRFPYRGDADAAGTGPRRRPSPSTPCRSTMAPRRTSPPITPGCLRAATGSNAWRGSDAMPAPGATLMVGAPKVRAGTGGPARVMALV